MQKTHYIFFLLSFFLNLLCAQNRGYIETISIPDGLSSPNATSVYQDRFGYTWIMTEDGLNRYDGKNIKIFRNNPDDPLSLGNNSVYSAVEDKEGYLWIGGLHFVYRFDYATENFKAFPIQLSMSIEKFNKVISLLTDSKGRVWAGNSGGYVHKLDQESGSFKLINFNENESQLNNSEIWNINELKNGKILFADFRNGIFQYNESSQKLDRYLLGENYTPEGIFRIQEDDDGTIWFSGDAKVIHYNPSFYSYEVLNELNVAKFLYFYGYHKISENNYVFPADLQGMIRYDPTTAKILEIIKTPWQPNWFISDKFGIMWLTSNGGLIKYDPLREPFTHIQFKSSTNQNDRNGIINYIQLDKLDKNYVWLLMSGNILNKYNLANNTSESFNLFQGQNKETIELDRFIQDRKGNFIFGSTRSGSIYQYDIQSRKISNTKDLSESLKPSTRVRDFALDQSNNLFVASTSGLDYYNATRKFLFSLPTVVNRKYNLKTQEIVQETLKNAENTALIIKANESNTYNIDFSTKEDGYYFIRCFGEGLFDDRSGQQMYDYGVLSHSSGKAVFKMDDYSKTFNAGGGLKNRKQYETLKLEKGDYNLKFYMDAGHSYGNFNVAMPADSELYGIQLYKITENAYKAIKQIINDQLSDPTAMPIGNVKDIEVSKKYSHSVYLASDTRGVFRYNIEDSTFKQYTFGEIKASNQKNLVQSCYEDLAGNLWVSTEQGLVMLNPDNSKWREFSEKDGLPSNNILNSIEDKNNDLWVISLGGLSKFNKNEPTANWNFVNYDTRDGLTGYSFNGDPVRTPDGEILFAVGDNLQRFTPGKSSTIIPDIVIDDFKISDISVFSSNSPLKLEKGLMETESITLPYDMNDLTFNFNVIHYSRPYKNKMFYKMEGFNTDWIESELGTATFTNLDPGYYEFKVRGISADGVRNDAGRTIKIEITPPWWKTNWAYLGYFLIFAGFIFGVDRIQRRRVLAKERAANAIKEAEFKMQLAESENERKTKELEEARSLQLSMLPKDLPQLPHLDIAVYMQTATEVGGDYYDFHVALDGTLTVVIGDATGHGMKAGTMVTTAKSLFRSYGPNPDILFSFQEITRCIKEMNFGKLSMCLTMLKIKGNKMYISTAGMPPSFIYRGDTRVVEEHLFKAMPLGTMENFPYELKDTTLQAGDTILLMSDGLPELTNSAGEMYGYQRIRNGFENNGGQPAENIIKYLKNEGASWVKNEDPDDDVTFVVIKVK